MPLACHCIINCLFFFPPFLSACASHYLYITVLFSSSFSLHVVFLFLSLFLYLFPHSHTQRLFCDRILLYNLNFCDPYEWTCVLCFVHLYVIMSWLLLCVLLFATKQISILFINLLHLKTKQNSSIIDCIKHDFLMRKIISFSFDLFRLIWFDFHSHFGLLWTCIEISIAIGYKHWS